MRVLPPLSFLTTTYLFLVLALSAACSQAPCAKTYRAAEAAYTYSSNALYTADEASMKKELKKAMDRFEASMLSAQDCQCEEAYSYADEGYSQAERGYQATDIQELRNYASGAAAAAYEVMTESAMCPD